jgi:multidrug efflux pump
MLIFAVVMLLSIYFMFVTTWTELAPTEDQSILFFQRTFRTTARPFRGIF